MNFTFTWILDKFGLAPRAELDIPKPATKVARKVAAKKKPAAKKTVKRKPKA